MEPGVIKPPPWPLPPGDLSWRFFPCRDIPIRFGVPIGDCAGCPPGVVSPIPACVCIADASIGGVEPRCDIAPSFSLRTAARTEAASSSVSVSEPPTPWWCAPPQPALLLLESGRVLWMFRISPLAEFRDPGVRLSRPLLGGSIGDMICSAGGFILPLLGRTPPPPPPLLPCPTGPGSCTSSRSASALSGTGDGQYSSSSSPFPSSTTT